MFCESYLQTLIDGAASVRSHLPDFTNAAECAASRLLDGGDLYIASVRPDFVSEGYVRSGGMMMLREYESGAPSSRDVVIASWSNTDSDAERSLISEIGKTGAFVTGIGPETDFSGSLDAFLPSLPSCPDTVLAHLDNNPYPIVSLQNLILLWTFTGELVAALTRGGTMPVMYQSVLVPGARDRHASFETRRFHPTHDVPAIREGQLGGSYLDKISICLRSLQSEIPALAQAASISVDALKANNQIHAFLVSHFPIHQAGAPGDPGYMTPLEIFKGETPDVAELERKLEPGDLFFFLGYYHRPIEAYEVARRRECTIVEVITGADDQPTPADCEPDHAIDPGWHYTDSLVDVPGYDVPILPASGILQTAVYWSVVGRITESIAAIG